MKHFFIFSLTVLFLPVRAISQYFPSVDFPDLFHEVQMNRVFEDSKTFPDCTPLFHPVDIRRRYYQQKNDSLFNLEKFVLKNFELPPQLNKEYKSDTSVSVISHIQNLWPLLIRNMDTATGSLISLPHPHVVPGGRFREIYYWDSYFTMLGLAVSGKNKQVRDMIDNFSHLIDSFGYIPNGNRTYYLSRSQPPFFSFMIELLVSLEGEQVLVEYLPYLKKEYMFRIKDKGKLDNKNPAIKRVVLLKDGEVLNRYWDNHATPRPESYREDLLILEESGRNPNTLYRDIRAACESGWDFSSRWLQDGISLETIHTTEIIPVDLNSLLYHHEKILAKAYEQTDNNNLSELFHSLAKDRKNAITKYCWNTEAGFFMDYDFTRDETTGIYSLAGIYPLFVGIATPKQAGLVAKKIKKHFLFDGGVSTTLIFTGQQWDAPNGWPPLQYITIKGLNNYRYEPLADSITGNWLSLNKKVFKKNGKMVEKYNVLHVNDEAGGGEYPLQDGFGWTNGIFLKLVEIY